MDKVQKQLLQASINHGTMTINNVKILVGTLCDIYDVEVPENKAALKSLIAEINNNIKKYDQQLEFVKHSLNDEEYLVFALSRINYACKFQPNYTDTERKFFYKLLENLVNSDDYGIEWQTIYAVAKQLPPNAQHPLSNERIQELHTMWVSQGYFLFHKDKLYFGPRTILEYSTYLKNNFSELLNDCAICKKVVYWDEECSFCKVKIHRGCIKNYLNKNSTCPNCKKSWRYHKKSK